MVVYDSPFVYEYNPSPFLRSLVIVTILFTRTGLSFHSACGVRSFPRLLFRCIDYTLYLYHWLEYTVMACCRSLRLVRLSQGTRVHGTVMTSQGCRASVKT